ncbi:uncharacterized protein EI90DRAFT_3066525 [Cantharellus anzutake]|uniref:uncharacterized protein n=1 Tax=Cantharellus anzutake TaxID=1750568 RepID=UPI0019035451|nr:uncharacterized protein EI90DRAFT_3066525 [Cantharellus anzutake]KAF8327963.1 hypothetical protein EI90DRAFT_3066525 [Cantharellus anzutake]
MLEGLSDHTGQHPSVPTQPEGSTSRDSYDAGSEPSDLAEDNRGSDSDEATNAEVRATNSPSAISSSLADQLVQ